MKKPVRVAVTGAAGQIGYALIFRVAAGNMLGSDQPITLQLLEVPAALGALQGVAMELDDCAFPLLHGVVTTDKAEEAFAGADYAVLVGAKPRTAGMERKDLLQDNARIFSGQGRALNAVASRQVRVLVVGNPANTNCLIASQNAPDLDPRCFSAMMRLDHNRAMSQLAARAGGHVNDVRHMIVWGNHSSTQYPDIHHATMRGRPALEVVDAAWMREQFIPTVQQRGSAIINARGASSAASAANAAIDQVRSWALGTPGNDWVSMAIASDGSYDVAKDIFYSFPVTCSNGEYRIVPGLVINDFSRERMHATEKELLDEREAVSALLP